MKLKFKALALGALAVLAVAASSSGIATATGGGHFVSGSSQTLVKLTSNVAHNFTWWNSTGTVTCEKAAHEGTAFGTTFESVSLAPIWEGGCFTGDGKTSMLFTPNGCTFRFKVASGTTASTEQTFDVVCPVGKVFEIDQPSCLVTLVPQLSEKAATYTTTEANGKHAITVDLHATLETQFHGGFCVFLGTKQWTTLKGSAILSGSNPEGAFVALTAT